MTDRRVFRFAGQMFVWAIVVAAGAAVAAPKDSSGGAADCQQRADLQFSIDNAQCSGYPPSEARNVCLVQAVQTYASATAACSQQAKSMGPLRTMRAPTTATIKADE